MHSERVSQLSLEASLRFHSQEVHMSSLRDHVSRLENVPACLAASRVTDSPDSDPTAIYVALRQKLRESEQREQQLAQRADHLHAELVDCQDQAEYAADQANYNIAGADREHQAALATLTKDVDDLMTETQEQTQAVLDTVNAQLRHETLCYHDECSAARALRSEVVLLTANQTRPASPASNQFRSPFGSPPKSLAASVGLNTLGVIPPLPTHVSQGRIHRRGGLQDFGCQVQND